MQEAIQQPMIEGYCKHCKKNVKWIKHADFDYYVCGTVGCNNRDKNPSQLKSPEINKPQHYFTYV